VVNFSRQLPPAYTS